MPLKVEIESPMIARRVGMCFSPSTTASARSSFMCLTYPAWRVTPSTVNVALKPSPVTMTVPLKMQGSTTAPRLTGLSAVPTVRPPAEQSNDRVDDVLLSSPMRPPSRFSLISPASETPPPAATDTEVNLLPHCLPLESMISSTTAEVIGLMVPVYEVSFLLRAIVLVQNTMPSNEAEVEAFSLTNSAGMA